MPVGQSAVTLFAGLSVKSAVVKLRTTKIGIHSIEIALPLGRITVEDMARHSGAAPAELLEEIGVFEKPVLEVGQEIFTYGVQAAKQVLDGAKISCSDLGLVIFASCGVSRRQMWSDSL